MVNPAFSKGNENNGSVTCLSNVLERKVILQRCDEQDSGEYPDASGIQFLCRLKNRRGEFPHKTKGNNKHQISSVSKPKIQTAVPYVSVG